MSQQDTILENERNGNIYAEQDAAALVQEEHNKIDILKKELMGTKSQKKRQEILKGFDYQFQTVEARNRMNIIEGKVNRNVPNIVKISKVMGFSVLISFLLIVAVNIYVIFLNGNQEAMSRVAAVLSFVFLICLIIWIIQKIIILLIKKHRRIII